MFVDELVESILASIQWDRWRFLIPTAKPQLRQDVAVVSHSHLDHWHLNFKQKDVVLVPWKLNPPKQFRDLKNILTVQHSQYIDKIKFTPLGPRELSHVLRRTITCKPQRFGGR